MKTFELSEIKELTTGIAKMVVEEYHLQQKPTLRDQFAMAALPTIISMQPSYNGNAEDSLLKCDCEAAYLYADGMLKTREEKPQ